MLAYDTFRNVTSAREGAPPVSRGICETRVGFPLPDAGGRRACARYSVGEIARTFAIFDLRLVIQELASLTPAPESPVKPQIKKPAHGARALFLLSTSSIAGWKGKPDTLADYLFVGAAESCGELSDSRVLTANLVALAMWDCPQCGRVPTQANTRLERATGQPETGDGSCHSVQLC